MNPAAVVVREITLADIAGYRACVGAVMRERRFLAYLEPFSLTQTAAFVADNIDKGNPHYVAEGAGEIVGWCDIQRESVPTYAHEGMLGMGLWASSLKERGFAAARSTACTTTFT